MVLQPHQSFLVIAHQHTFARRVIYCRREKLLMLQLHAVQGRFGSHMRIIRVIRHDRIPVISKDRKTVFLGFLLQISDMFRIDTAFKYHLSVGSVNHLATVIREDIPVICTQFQFLGQWQQTVSGTSRCQHDAYAHLLHFEQRVQRPLANLLLVVQQCPVHVEH